MRTPITLKIKFKSSSLEQFIERYSVDVSRGGIFIRTKEPLPVGTQLRFEFQLQDTSALISGDGTVVWLREPDPARQGVAPGMGVRFDKLSSESQQVLDRILAEKQRRGDAQVESRFDAGVRASQAVSGILSLPTKESHTNGIGRELPPLGEDEEFGKESTRVMQNELMQSLAEQTRDGDDEFGEPEMTRKASLEELQRAVQGSKTESEPIKAKAEAPKADSAKADAPKAEPAPPRKEPAATPPVKVAPADPEPTDEPDDEPVAAKAPPREEREADEEPRAAKPIVVERPAAKRSRSALPVVLGLAVVVVAGGYTLLRAQREEATPPAVAPGQGPAAPEPATPPPTEAPAPTQAPAPTPAPTPTVPAGLTVPVSSDPPGATVTVDGKPLESPTPTTLTGLDAKKTYDVRLALKGFHEWKVRLKPRAGEEVKAALVPSPKWVRVTSTPSGAEVLIDGRRMGRTPMTIRKIDLSRPHTLLVKRAGYLPQQEPLSAAGPFQTEGDKEVLALALTLEAAPKAGAHRPSRATAPVVTKPGPVAGKPAPAPSSTTATEAAPAEKPAPAAPSEEKAPLPSETKPAPTPEEKPATEKPAAEKPAPEKSSAEKPAEAPAEPATAKEKPNGGAKSGIKVPTWMKGQAAPAPAASASP